MKRFLLSFVAVVGLLATSCVQDATDDLNVGKQGLVTFAVDAQHTSRAYGVADEAKHLYYAVYQNGTLLNAISVLPPLPGEEPKPVELIEGAANVSIPLATGLTYELIFWAASPAAISEELYWLDFANKTMTLNDNALVASDESLDAFYYRGTFEVSGTATHTITLKRPFAQINVATGDTEEAKKAGLEVADTWFEVSGAYNTLNLATGIAEGPTTLTYDAAAKPADEQIRANNKDYDLLGVIYVLANEGKSSLNNVKFSYNRNAGETTAVKTIEVPSAPIKRNARTNLVGNILTSNNGFDVDIDEGFEEPGTNIEVWDGSTVKEPAYDDTTKTYSISCAAELAYIAQLVNGTLDTDNVSRAAVAANSLVGCTVKLVNDIALNDMEWTPIGNGKHFMGTFDGNHKIISGLKVTKRGDCRAALFGTVSGTVVFRNLTISGAEVRCPDFKGDFYGSALIGTAYGVVTIENVDVVDSYISGNNKVGALIAHDGVMNTLTVSGCDVSGTTFEALNAADGGSVGGLLGYFQTGGEHHITNCSVKGCTFNVVNSRNNGARANGLLIGGINSKANQKLYINGSEIDGITWNEKFYVDGVEVTEGKFVSPYGGLIGGERDDHAEGELYLENELVVPTNYVYTAEQLAEVVNGATEDITVTFANDLEGTVLLKQKQGVNVTILGNDKNYNGVLSLRGYMEYGTSKLTIKNVHFNAGATADACILGEDKGVTGVYAYSHCVTIDHCTFSGNSGCAAVRHEDGGDSNYTFKNCEVDNTMHSMIQSNNILGNLIVEDCKVYSKNGANLNSTCNATFTGCEFDVKGYAVRVGVKSGGNPTEAKTFTFENSTLKSACEDGDAVVMIRASAANATLNFVNTTLEGTTKISGVVAGETKVYFDGAEYVGNGLYKSGSTYKVENAEGLALLNSKMCDKTAGRAIVVELSSDIDFTGKTWTPVDSHVDFGFIITEFNGNGHTISNLIINGQAMFTRFSNTRDVVVKDVTFDNATVNSTSINTAIIVGHTYDNLLLENVDVKNSTIVGGYKVAALVGTVYNESASTITATLKGCDVENTTVKALTYDFTTAGFVAFVYSDNNDRVAFENCSINGLKLYAPNVYNYHAAVYTESLNDDIVLHNEAEGVTVTNVTFENI